VPSSAMRWWYHAALAAGGSQRTTHAGHVTAATDGKKLRDQPRRRFGRRGRQSRRARRPRGGGFGGPSSRGDRTRMVVTPDADDMREKGGLLSNRPRTPIRLPRAADDHDGQGQPSIRINSTAIAHAPDKPAGVLPPAGVGSKHLGRSNEYSNQPDADVPRQRSCGLRRAR
jgi:hypothetical protein